MTASPPDVRNLAKWGTSNFTPLVKLSPGQDHPSEGVLLLAVGDHWGLRPHVKIRECSSV